MTVQALANLILVVVKDAREFLGGETRGEEVLRRDVCGEDEVPPFVVRQPSRKDRRVLGKAGVPALKCAPVLGVEVGRRRRGRASFHGARHVKYGMLAAKVARRHDLEALVFQEPTDVLLP